MRISLKQLRKAAAAANAGLTTCKECGLVGRLRVKRIGTTRKRVCEACTPSTLVVDIDLLE